MGVQTFAEKQDRNTTVTLAAAHGRTMDKMSGNRMPRVSVVLRVADGRPWNHGLLNLPPRQVGEYGQAK